MYAGRLEDIETGSILVAATPAATINRRALDGVRGAAWRSKPRIVASFLDWGAHALL